MEWIDYRVRIGDDGKIGALGSFSTYRPRGTNYRKSSGKAMLELVSKSGEVLVQEAVAITAPPQCHTFESGYRFAEGRVPLLKGAAGLRLVEGKTILHEQQIGVAPEIRLDWQFRKVNRSKPVPLKLQLSKATDDALLFIGLEWERGRMIGLGVRKPAPTIQIDFGALPGGPECKLHVAYTSGLRTNRASTAPFALALPKTNGKILQPRTGGKYVSDQIIVLEADVTPGDLVVDQSIEWHLDGRVVAVGRHAVLNGYAVGEYELILLVGGDRIDAVTVSVSAK